MGAETVALKRCGKCGDLLPLSGFHRNRGKRDGLQPHCRDCTNARSAEVRAKKRPKMKPPPPLDPDALREAASIRWGLEDAGEGVQGAFADVLRGLVRDGDYPEFRQMYEYALEGRGG